MDIRQEVVPTHNGSQQFVPWRVTDVAIATALLFATFLALQILLGLIIGIGDVEERTIPIPLLAGALEGLLLVAVWVFGINRYRARWSTLGLRRTEIRWVLTLPWLALLGSLIFAGIYSGIITAMGLDSLKPSPIPEDILGHGLSRLLNTLIIVVWGPFTEEVFFRGFMLAALVPSFGVIRAVIISSAIFAAAHFTLGVMIPLFVTGMLLSWLYLKTRSIWPPLAAHAAQNLIAVSVMP